MTQDEITKRVEPLVTLLNSVCVTHVDQLIFEGADAKEVNTAKVQISSTAAMAFAAIMLARSIGERHGMTETTLRQMFDHIVDDYYVSGLTVT